MSLFNKLTILSIFILLATCICLPVMAHQPDADQTFAAAHDGVDDDDPDATDTAETDHTHAAAAPMISSITAVDTKGNVPGTASGEGTSETLKSNVDKMKIVLVDDVSAADNTRLLIKLDGADTTTTPPTPATLQDGQFVLKITFNQDVYVVDAAGTTAAAAPTVGADDLPDTAFTFTAATKNAAGVDIGSSFAVDSISRVVTSAAGATPVVHSKREFLVTVAATVNTLEAANLPVSIWVRVAANQVYSLTALSGANTLQGRGNAEYLTPSAFMLNGYMEPDEVPTPRETDSPTVEIAAPTRVTTAGSTDNLNFTLTFSEAIVSLVESDLTITGGSFVSSTSDDAKKVWTVAIDPTGDPANTEVTVTLNDQSVSDESGNRYMRPTAGPDTGRYDTVNPTVHPIAGGPAAPVAAGAVKLKITFSEKLGEEDAAFANADIDRTNSNVLLSSAQPMKAATQPTGGAEVWELTVTPVPADAPQVIIVIKESSIADVAGNVLENDTVVTWTRPTVGKEKDKPVVAITLADGMTYVDSVSGGMVTVAASDNDGGSGLASGAEIVESEVTVANGSIMAGSFTKGATATFRLIPNTAATTVTVTVAAGAVADTDGNTNALQTDMTKPNANPKTFNVGPIFTVPAGAGNANPGYLVITKTAGMTHQFISDQPTIHTSPDQTAPPTPAPNIMVNTWGNMPDLERLFNLGSGNGGTLNIKAAATNKKADGTAIGTANVRITEVMWAIDVSMRGALNDAEAAEQWVEVENPNGHEVKIIIYARTGRDSAVTHIGNPDGHIDRIGNAYNGGPGSGAWNVPGKNGNSHTGDADFVSMWRRYHENNRGKGYANGTASGAWSESSNIYLTTASTSSKLYNHRGTPGRLQSVNLPDPNRRVDNPTNIPSSPFIINEVGNRDSGNREYEWIEIKNVTGSPQNLRNYIISMVTAVDRDQKLIEFPNNNNASVPAGGVILLLASDPRYDDDHPIAVGYNVDVGANDQVDGLGLVEPDSNRKPPRQKVITFHNNGLPDDGNFILILRRPDKGDPNHGSRSGGDGGKGVAELGAADVDLIIDIAGHHEGLDKGNYPATTHPPNLNSTTLWPLHKFDAQMKPHRGHGDWNHRRHNRLEANRIRYRQHVKTTAKNDADGAVSNRAGTGTTHKNEDVGHYAMRDANYTGLGYRRTARILGVHNGTPGYDGNTVANTGVVKATAADTMVTISEIMYSTGPNPDRVVYPQWIELYNMSPTNAVNLHNWKLRFEMLDENGDPMDSLMNLDLNKGRVKTIPPQQTILIVAGNAQANSDAKAGIDVFNDNRVFNVQRDVGVGKFGKNTRYMFFNPKAFNIALVDKDNKVVDAVGNLDGDARTSDTNKWEFPMGVTEDGRRTSLIRVYDNRVARDGVNTAESNVMPIFGMGDKMLKGNDGIDSKWSFIPAANTKRDFKITIKHTWYGAEDDYGTPNNRPGIVLPVSLSYFRPTLADGEVTIRWTTESELDNAGFNIYRSETRTGEFKQVNAELIAGNGTTGERNSYKWVDTTAKPGVVYYYQIEDVSFAGERQTLATTKLKGLISAKNKLTTTWSELKNLR